MTTSPPSPVPAESQPPAVADHLAWRRRIPALAAAAVGIKQASDDWDAVSDSFCDAEGWPLDEKGYADGKVKRDATAWDHVEVFLDHGPAVVAGIRAHAAGADWVEGPVSDDLRHVHGLDTALRRAGQIRHEWDQVIALMDASLPGSRALYEERAKEHRNSEGWHYADEMAVHGPAVVRAAEYLATRADAEQPAQTERARAALTRSASRDRGATPDSPPAASPPATPAPRRSR